MASNLLTFSKLPLVFKPLLFQSKSWGKCGFKRSLGIRVSNGGDSYLDMWKKAVDRERKAVEFQKIEVEEEDEGEDPELLERKTSEFEKLLEVSPEERDQIQRMQVIDRAAAAIAAARALIKESNLPSTAEESVEIISDDEKEDEENATIFVSSPGNSASPTPGPSFWSWTPPNNDLNDENTSNLAKKTNQSSIQPNPVIELDRTLNTLSIPLESKIENSHNPPLPPMQSLIEIESADDLESDVADDLESDVAENTELEVQFSDHAVNAARALEKVAGELTEGTYEDGKRWWRETGTEVRADGAVCRWTLTRGVSSDKSVEWEEKYWEAADEYDYKELGSEKSGRDSSGNVWREYWKESMYKDDEGNLHMEKTADKWGKNGQGGEWHEKWWEGYGASGQAGKWAHKWCSIDPNTQLDAGHAHVWHERWGEKYDGQGGSTKYTDKWAERSEGDRWAKWGDKWDENFDPNGQGVKQGETWWEGKHGERWNRTWGEGHNGTGWVHKYGKSSSGEHWDTHEQQDTWYERFPHFGFYHCFENSVQLREVKKPSESQSTDI